MAGNDKYTGFLMNFEATNNYRYGSGEITNSATQPSFRVMNVRNLVYSRVRSSATSEPFENFYFHENAVGFGDVSAVNSNQTIKTGVNMEWKPNEDLSINMEYKHGVLFAQTVSRMRYLKEVQLLEVHRIVSDMWETKRRVAREEKQKQEQSQPAAKHDII